MSMMTLTLLCLGRAEGAGASAQACPLELPRTVGLRGGLFHNLQKRFSVNGRIARVEKFLSPPRASRRIVQYRSNWR